MYNQSVLLYLMKIFFIIIQILCFIHPNELTSKPCGSPANLVALTGKPCLNYKSIAELVTQIEVISSLIEVISNRLIGVISRLSEAIGML